MDPEQLRKYLDQELSDEELEAFESTEEYRLLQKVDANLSRFENAQLSKDELYAKIRSARHAKTIPMRSRGWLAVAASFIAFILAGWYLLIKSDEVAIYASDGLAYLPDSTVVMVNSKSQVSYESDSYLGERTVQLRGEAFFEVREGSQFKVIGHSAVITVLGTRFKVKERPEHMEVICTEGKVLVEIEGNSEVLTAGMSAEFLGENLVVRKPEAVADIWQTGQSIFDNDPLRVVITELERQYEIAIETSGVDLSDRFTGAFSHDNLEQAVQSISLPFHLDFKVEKDRVILTGETK